MMIIFLIYFFQFLYNRLPYSRKASIVFTLEDTPITSGQKSMVKRVQTKLGPQFSIGYMKKKLSEKDPSLNCTYILTTVLVSS